MSSLAAARADNFYHPPCAARHWRPRFRQFYSPFALVTLRRDWDPRKRSRAEHDAGKGRQLSKDERWKAHPLRERAKKLHTEGILTIRFEMPFNVRCIGCGNHIGKGVRFNAEKKKIGKYLSTNILSFRMLCHCEDGTSRTDRRLNPHFIEVHTDPKNAEYVIAEGAVRVHDPALLTPDELGVEHTLDEDEAAARSSNPFHRLEAHGSAPKPKPWLSRLEEMRQDLWHDDYDLNRTLRRTHRSQQKAERLESATLESKGIHVPLPSEHLEDIALAAVQRVRTNHAEHIMKRNHIMASSIFGSRGENERLGQLRKRRELGMQITARRPAFSHRTTTTIVGFESKNSLHPPGDITEPQPDEIEGTPWAAKDLTGEGIGLRAGATERSGHQPQRLVAYSDSEEEG